MVADIQKKLDQEVFIHGRPASHEQAEQWMREETLAAKNLEAHAREKLSSEARVLVSDLTRHLSDGDTGSITRGILASRIQLLKDLAQRLSEASSKFISPSSAPIEDALAAGLKRPGLFNKTQPESRMTEFQAALAGAVETSISSAFRSELKQQLEISFRGVGSNFSDLNSTRGTRCGS